MPSGWRDWAESARPRPSRTERNTRARGFAVRSLLVSALAAPGTLRGRLRSARKSAGSLIQFGLRHDKDSSQPKTYSREDCSIEGMKNRLRRGKRGDLKRVYSRNRRVSFTKRPRLRNVGKPVSVVSRLSV